MIRRKPCPWPTAYSRPKTRFVASFIGETNFIEGRVEEGAGESRRIRTRLGEFVSRAFPADLQAGEEVTLSIRPETLRLNDAPAGVPNVLEGLVHDSIYLGEVAQHQVRIGGEAGENLKVFDLNPRIVARDAAETARVWVEPRDVVVLRN